MGGDPPVDEPLSAMCDAFEEVGWRFDVLSSLMMLAVICEVSRSRSSGGMPESAAWVVLTAELMASIGLVFCEIRLESEVYPSCLALELPRERVGSMSGIAGAVYGKLP